MHSGRGEPLCALDPPLTCRSHPTLCIRPAVVLGELESDENNQHYQFNHLSVSQETNSSYTLNEPSLKAVALVVLYLHE